MFWFKKLINDGCLARKHHIAYRFIVLLNFLKFNIIYTNFIQNILIILQMPIIYFYNKCMEGNTNYHYYYSKYIY